MERHLKEVQILRRVLPRDWSVTQVTEIDWEWHQALQEECEFRVRLNRWLQNPFVDLMKGKAIYTGEGCKPSPDELLRVQVQEQEALRQLTRKAEALQRQATLQVVDPYRVLGLSPLPRPYQVHSAYMILRAENQRDQEWADQQVLKFAETDKLDTWKGIHAQWESEMKRIIRNRIIAAYDQMLEKVGSKRPSRVRLFLSRWF